MHENLNDDAIYIGLGGVLFDKLDCFFEVARQIKSFMILTRNVLVVRYVATAVVQSCSTCSCDDCFYGMAIESFGILCCFEIADVDAANIVFIRVVDALDVLRIHRLRLQAHANG